MRICFLTLMLILLTFSNAYAQNNANVSATNDNVNARPDSNANRPAYYVPSPTTDTTRDITRTLYETQLGWAVLGFGAFLIFLEVAVMLRLKGGWETQSIRIVGITLVVVAGLFLIVAGYSQEQIAPMIGLLGTIIGFLLGKTSSDAKNKDTD